ncbi:Uncharacterized protein GBIM_16537 [Gryllus bimaculatus]|nr:Uncharacterized protein GBIM_16537 [Gryllus bimaculatus]
MCSFLRNVTMGNCHRCVIENETSRIRKRIVLLLVGLDNAGKTSTAKGLIGETGDTEVPTVGFSSVSLVYGKHSVIIYDLGGGPQIRGIWHRYFVDVHGIIFVVDASDMTRLDECRSVLNNLLTHPKLAGKPVLLLANKQDCEGALDELDIVEKLDLEALVNQQRCPTMVETCSASVAKNSKRKLDPAIHNGYKWLVNSIIRDFPALNARVLTDMAEQKKVEDAERRERLLRYVRSQQMDDTSLNDTGEHVPDDLVHDPFRPITEVVGNNSKIMVCNGNLSKSNSQNKPEETVECSNHGAGDSKEDQQLELEKTQNKKTNFFRRANKTGPAPLMSSTSEKSSASDPESGGQDSGFASPPKQLLPPLQLPKYSQSVDPAPWTRVPLNVSSRTELSQDGAWDLHKAFEVVPVCELDTEELMQKDDEIT